jgi:hypothetical protein
LSRTFQRHYWSLVFRFAAKEQVAGVPVATLLPERPRLELAAKSRAALGLIAEFDPRQLRRLKQLVAGVFIFDDTGPVGAWMREPRLIRLNEKFVAAPDTADAEVAATIVHETTHAWLEARGFVYRADRRRRLEAICFRAEAAFARRLPDGSALANYYEERAAGVLAQSDADWSDAAFHASDVARLRALHAPEWIVEWIARRRGRRAA